MCFLKETETQKAQRASDKITYKSSQLRFDLFKTCQVFKKRLTREYNYGIIIVVVNIGMSPSGKAPDFDSGIRRFKSGHPSQKSENFVLGFFICAAGTTSFARKGNIISSEARTSLPLAAQMNEVEALSQMMWAYAQ